MKRFYFGQHFEVYGTNSVEVPDDFTLEQAQKYVTGHWDDIGLTPTAEYTTDSGEPYFENCKFEDIGESIKMNKKTVILFQDNETEDYIDLESRLTALLFDKETAKQAYSVFYTEDEYEDEECRFNTIDEITEELDKNGIQYEIIDLRFIDYNTEE